MSSVTTLKAIITADDTQFHSTVQKDVKELGGLDRAAEKAAGGVKKLGDAERGAANESKNLGEATKGAGAGTNFLQGALQGVGQYLSQTLIGLIGQAAKKAFDMANAFADTYSDINEAVSKNQALFGKSADAIDAWSKTTAKSMGISRSAALDAAGNYGNLFRGMNMGEKASAGLSKNLVRLAGDLASFDNKPIEQALGAIQSGLVGETRPLRDFGVMLSENAIKAEAMRIGLFKGKGELGEQAKALAIVSLLTKQTAQAQGDFAKTADGAANKSRILAARYEDAGAKIGQFILPLKVAFMDAMLKAIGVIEKITPAIGKFIQDATAGFARLKTEVAPILASVWGGIKTGVADAHAAWDSNFAGIRTSTQKAAAAVWGYVQSYFGEVTAWFKENMPLIRETVKNGLAAIQRFWELYGANITQAVKALWGILTTAFTLGMRIVTGVVRVALLVINGHWEQAGQAVIKLVGDMMQGAIDITNKGSDLLIAAVKGIIKGIWNLHQWSEDVAFDIGNAITAGIINGIKSGAVAVWNAIQDLLTHPTAGKVTAAMATIGSPILTGLPGVTPALGGGAGGTQPTTLATTTPASAAAAMVKGSASSIADTVKKAHASIVSDGKALAGALSGGIALAAPGAIKESSDLAAGAVGKVKKKLTEAQQEWKAFADFAAEQRAALASAMSGDDSASMQLAKRFRFVSEARRDEIAGVMEKIKAITAEAAATKGLEDKVKALYKEIALARAKTPEQRARIENDLPTGPLNQKQQGFLKDILVMTPIKVAQDAAKVATEAMATARKNLADQIEKERRATLAAIATREVDRQSLLETGKTFDKVSDKGNRAYIVTLAARASASAFVAGLASTAQGIGESMAATLAGLTDALKPATDRIAELRKEILLSRQTTIEGVEAVNLYGVAFENLSASAQGAVRSIALVQRQQAFGQGMDALGGIGAAFGAAGDAVRKGQDQQAAERAKQQRQFVEGLTNAALHYGRGFVEALLNGGGGVKKWFSNLVSSSIPAFADTVIERTIKPQLENIFSGMVKSVTGTLNVTQQVVGQMLASVYSIMVDLGAMGSKKQKGGLLGGLVGGLIGLAVGGPAGAFAGFNVGTAAGAGYASGGIGGAVLGGGLSYVSQRGGPGAIFGSGKGGGTVSMETGSSSGGLGSGNVAGNLNAAMNRGEHVGGNFTAVGELHVYNPTDATVVTNKIARIAAARASR